MNKAIDSLCYYWLVAASFLAITIIAIAWIAFIAYQSIIEVFRSRNDG